MNWRTIPFVRLLSPFLLGTVLSLHISEILLPLYLSILGALSLIWFSFHFFRIPFRYRYLPGLLLHCWLFLFGFIYTQQQNHLLQANHFKNYNAKWFVGEVKTLHTKEKRIQLQIKIQYAIDSLHQKQEVKGNLLLYLPKDAKSAQLALRDLIVIECTPKAIASNLNPKAFDYRRYLHYQNIHFQAYCSAEQWHVYQKNQQFSFSEALLNWRNYCLKILRTYLGFPNEYAIASALLLGERQALNDELKAAYSETGAIHVLAVSGLHVGIICMVIQYLLQLIPLSSKHWRIAQTIILLLFIWLFAIFTGASASVLRASSMFSLIILGQLLHESASIYNILAASAFCLLLYHPYFIQNIGFQLSYAAVLGIVYFQPKIYRLFYIQNPLLNYAWQLIAVSLAAQLTTLPLSLYYFHQFPFYFWLSSLIVVPAATFIIALGILLFLAVPIAQLAVFMGTGLNLLIRLINQLIVFIQHLPASLLSGIWWPLWLVLVYYICLAFYIWAIARKKSNCLIIGLLFVSICSVQYAWQSGRAEQSASITIYAMGRNSLLEFRDGRQCFAFSPKPIGEKAKHYATANFHAFNQIQIRNSHLLRDTVQTESLYLNYPFFQFRHITGLLVNSEYDLSYSPNFKVDVLLLHSNPSIQLKQIWKKHRPKVIVFDQSNSPFKRKYWAKVCVELGINYHDINEKGAFIYSIKQDTSILSFQ